MVTAGAARILAPAGYKVTVGFFGCTDKETIAPVVKVLIMPGFL